MAGSYNHCVDTETGKLLVNEDLVAMLENGGDVYEAVEEMYGMVWWLADLASENTRNAPGITAADLVEIARGNYRQGLELSPGTDGRLPEDDE